MLIVVIVLAIMLALIDRASRIEHVERRKTETSFKLYRLRDQLRFEAAIELIPMNSWFFYLDSTLTRTYQSINEVTLWHAIALENANRSNESLEKAREKRFCAFQEEANKRSLEIYRQYRHYLFELLRVRHSTLIAAISMFYRVHRIGRQLGDAVKIFTSAPETSTLLRYAT